MNYRRHVWEECASYTAVFNINMHYLKPLLAWVCTFSLYPVYALAHLYFSMSVYCSTSVLWLRSDIIVRLNVAQVGLWEQTQLMALEIKGIPMGNYAMKHTEKVCVLCKWPVALSWQRDRYDPGKNELGPNGQKMCLKNAQHHSTTGIRDWWEKQ